MAQKKEISDNFIKRLFQGRIISSDFFKQNWYKVGGILLLFIIFIASKYHCQTQIAQIMDLRRDLNNAKTDRVRASAEYNSKIRETEMRTLVDSMRIGIEMPKQPPYEM